MGTEEMSAPNQPQISKIEAHGLEITHCATEQGVIIVRCAGKIAGKATQYLEAIIKATIDDGAKRLLLNLKKISMIDSDGLQTLTACLAYARQNNAQIALLYPSIQSLAVQQKLESEFEYWGQNEQDAIGTLCL